MCGPQVDFELHVLSIPVWEDIFQILKYINTMIVWWAGHMRVFSDENLEVIYRAGASPYLLITFNEMEMKANGSRFWGQRFCEKAEISALGFISRRPNWFPAASVVKAVEAAATILHAAPERILYGHSQGGYAALR